MYADHGSEMDVVASQFLLNTAETSGGAIYTKSSSARFTDSVFHANQAASDGAGGAIYLQNVISCTMLHTSYTENVAWSAGAVLVAHSVLQLIDSSFAMNTATRSGGAVVLAQGLPRARGVGEDGGSEG